MYPKSGRQEKNTSGIHGDVLFQVQSLCRSWGNNSDVDYRIYKYKFRVLLSNLIILFTSHTWGCYKSVFQSIQNKGGSVYWHFACCLQLNGEYSCCTNSALFLLSRKILMLNQYKGQKSAITGMKDVSEFTYLLWGNVRPVESASDWIRNEMSGNMDTEGRRNCSNCSYNAVNWALVMTFSHV